MPTATPRNVFVLSPGRSGSKTMAIACAHFDGWTSAHESRSTLIGADRLDYPLDHVESDNRLCFVLGRLVERFGDDALYVQLRRDPELVAASYNRRWTHPVHIMPAYHDGVLMRGGLAHIDNDTPDGLAVCRDYVATVNANVREFLRHRRHAMTLDLDDIVEQFPAFMDRIGARGDWSAIRADLQVHHNRSE